MLSLTAFYAIVGVYFISRVFVFIQKWSDGDFKAEGWSRWLVRETLLFGAGVFLWLTFIRKQQ